MMEKNPSDTRRHKRSHEIRKAMTQQGQIVQLKETDKKDRDREVLHKKCIVGVKCKPGGRCKSFTQEIENHSHIKRK